MAEAEESDWVYLVDQARPARPLAAPLCPCAAERGVPASQETGVSYYANLKTNETSWELPAEVGGEQSAPAYVKLENGWFQYTDDDTGRHYYYNNRTEQTVWSMPADAGGHPEANDYVSSDGEGVDEQSEYPSIQGADDTDDDDDDAEGKASNSARKAEEAEQKAKEKEEKRAARRLKILEEVLSSERVYVSALETLERVYLVPLRTVADQPKGAIFSHADLDAVFLNIEVSARSQGTRGRRGQRRAGWRGGRWQSHARR